MTDEDENEKELDKGEEETPPIAKKAMDPVRKWTFILLALALALTFVYLRADRITPYTSQARIHAFIVPIAPEVSGTITSVEVRNNQKVVAGQALFQVEEMRYRVAVQDAEAKLRTAQQAVGVSTASVDAARAQLESAKANQLRAWQDATRQRKIREEDPGAISVRRLQMAEASLSAATASTVAAEANVQKALEDLGEEGDANARIRQARAALTTAELNLLRTTVLAPEDGVVTGVRLDRGNFAAQGAPLMTFIAIHNIWVQADFTENNLGNIKAGDKVEIAFDALPGKIIKGEIREAAFGVAVDTATLGALPTIENDRQWLRDAQRFPVLIDFEVTEQDFRSTLRVGSQASVVVYTGNHGVFNFLGRLYIRFTSILSYVF